MVTITIPIIPTIFAVAFLIVTVWQVCVEYDGFLVALAALLTPIFIFFMVHGLLSLFGAY